MRYWFRDEFISITIYFLVICLFTVFYFWFVYVYIYLNFTLCTNLNKWLFSYIFIFSLLLHFKRNTKWNNPRYYTKIRFRNSCISLEINHWCWMILRRSKTVIECRNSSFRMPWLYVFLLRFLVAKYFWKAKLRHVNLWK